MFVYKKKDFLFNLPLSSSEHSSVCKAVSFCIQLLGLMELDLCQILNKLF